MIGAGANFLDDEEVDDVDEGEDAAVTTDARDSFMLEPTDVTDVAHEEVCDSDDEHDDDEGDEDAEDPDDADEQSEFVKLVQVDPHSEHRVLESTLFMEGTGEACDLHDALLHLLPVPTFMIC